VPSQRFLCSRCGFVGDIWYPMPEYSPSHQRLTAYPPCPRCAIEFPAPISQELTPYPDRMQHDLLTGGTGLDVLNATGDGEVRVSSLSEIRTIENESLRRARNGDGTPVVFRGFSQNRSNRHVNSLAGTEFEKNKSERIDPRQMKTTQGRPITAAVIPESQAPRE
jgi:hypothetical protein